MCITFAAVLIDGVRNLVCSSLVYLVVVSYPCMHMLDAISDRNSRPWRTYSLGRNAHQLVRQSKTVNLKTSKSFKLEYLVLFPKALAQLRILWGQEYSSVAGLLLSTGKFL